MSEALLVPVRLNVRHEPTNGGCGMTTEVLVYPNTGTFRLRVKCQACKQMFEQSITLRVVESNEFHAFGDESQFSEVLTYGIVVFHSADRTNAERDLARLKEHFGVDPNAEIHCWVMFSPEERAKSPWCGKSPESLLSFLRRVVLAMRDHRPMYRVSGLSTKEYPRFLPAADNFPAVDFTVKQLQALLYGGAVQPLVDRLGPDNVRIWIDPDYTKIPWFGRRMKAYRTLRVRNLDSGSVIEPEPVSKQEKQQPLIELADVLAYCASHALSSQKDRRKRDFERIYKVIRPELAVMKYDPTTKGPLSSLEQHHRRIFSIWTP